jgi:hypothetical protein
MHTEELWLAEEGTRAKITGQSATEKAHRSGEPVEL